MPHVHAGGPMFMVMGIYTTEYGIQLWYPFASVDEIPSTPSYACIEFVYCI